MVLGALALVIADTERLRSAGLAALTRRRSRISVMKHKEENVKKLSRGVSALGVVALLALAVTAFAGARPATHKASIQACVLPARHEVVGSLRAVRPAVPGRRVQGCRRPGDDQPTPRATPQTQRSQADGCLANGAKVICSTSSTRPPARRSRTPPSRAGRR